MAYYNTTFNQNMQSAPATQTPAFDPQQFSQIVATLNQPALEKLVMMARMQGISDKDIQDGLSIIKSLR